MKSKIEVILSDGSKLIVDCNGKRYIVLSIENKDLFNYMQDCYINVRQKHVKLEWIVKCFNIALLNMSYKPASNREFIERLHYKPRKTFMKRDYSNFAL